MAAHDAVFLHYLEKNYVLCQWNSDFGFRIPGAVLWIQSPGSRTPRAKFSHIPNTTSHNFPDSGVAYRERNVELFSFYRQRRMSRQPLQEWRYLYEYSWKLSLQVHICLHWQKLWKRSGSIWYLALNRLITEAQPVFNRLSFFQIHFLKSCLKSLFYILKWYKRVLAEVKRWKGDMKRKQLTKHFGIGFSRADNYI